MESNDSVSKFMGGIFLGSFVTAVVVLLIGYAVSMVAALSSVHAIYQIAIAVVIVILAIIVHPVLLKTVWSERRDPFLLDQDINAIIQGRLIGIPFGIIVAILIQNYVVG